MVAVKQAQSELFGPSNEYQIRDANRHTTPSLSNDKSAPTCEPPRSLNDPLTTAFNYLFAAKNILNSDHNDTPYQAVDYLQLASDALEEVSINVCNHTPKSSPAEQSGPVQGYALQDAIYEAASMAHLYLDNNKIHTQIKCAPQLPRVLIERTHIHQLIVNLMLYLVETSPLGSIQKFQIELSTIQYGHISVALSAVPLQIHARATTPISASAQMRDGGPANRLKKCRAILKKNGGDFITEMTNRSDNSFLMTLPNII